MQKLGVVGFGVMGVGIADVFARADLDVVVVDRDEAVLSAGLDALGRFHEKGIARDDGDAERLTAVLSRITTTTDFAGLAGADVVVETVGEDEAVKAQVLAQIARHVSEDCVIATNTTGLSITRLANNVTRPERFAGLHFFAPPQLLRVVEVVRPRLAVDATIETLRALAASVGSHPLMIRDQPGLLVDHLLLPYLNQAVQDYDDGLASATDIATAVKLGLGYPMGPLQLLDRIGLDVHLQATENIYAATRDTRFVAPPLLRELVDAGRLGNKTGAGLVAGSEQ